MPTFTRRRRTSSSPAASSAPASPNEATPAPPANAARPAADPAGSVDSPQSPEGHPALAGGLALNIARQLRECSEGDRWAFVHAIRGQVLKVRPERVVLSLNAMAVCREDTGRISKGLYETWRSQQINPCEWPSSQFISDTFGHSWKRAMAALGADAVVDVLVSDLTTDTHVFTKAEIVANLREYSEDPQRSLTFDAYREWAHERMLDSGRRQLRYIRSMRRIKVLFGTWSLTLVAAGLEERAKTGQWQVSRPRGTSRDYSPDRCRAWVRMAAPFCGDSKMTKDGYDKWARAHERDEARAGRHPVVPLSKTVCGAFGGWASALNAAGLIDDRELAQRADRRTAFVPDEDLVTALADVVAVHGLHSSTGTYDLHRGRVRREEDVHLPSSGLIRGRLGGWGQAVTLAAERLRANGVAVPEIDQTLPRRRRAARTLTAPDGQR